MNFESGGAEPMGYILESYPEELSEKIVKEIIALQYRWSEEFDARVEPDGL